MNYFSFFDIKESFFIDLSDLKKRYYQKSRELHPDFHTSDQDANQEEILRLSAYNNDAYNTLKDENDRMEYILRLHDKLGDEGSNKLDQDFLMEMMDINEALMELQMDPDENTKSKLIAEIEGIEKSLYSEVEEAMKKFSQSQDIDSLDVVLHYYLKKKYLLRIRDNLNRFEAL